MKLFGISLLGRAEAGRRRIVQAGAKRLTAGRNQRSKLIHDRIQDVRQVVGEEILPTHAVEVDVADAISGTDHGLVEQVVCKADTRSPVVAIGVDQRTVVNRSVLCLNDRVRRRIEVRQLVVAFVLRSCELITNTDVQCELRRDLEVILQIEEVHPLLVVHDGRRRKLILAARPEHEVGKELEVVVRRSGNLTEAARIGVCPIFWSEVIDLGIDGLILVSGFQAVRAQNLCRS